MAKCVLAGFLLASMQILEVAGRRNLHGHVSLPTVLACNATENPNYLMLEQENVGKMDGMQMLASWPHGAKHAVQHRPGLVNAHVSLGL